MPFSEGPRNCVGQSLAKIEVLAVLATLLGYFRVELDPAVRLQYLTGGAGGGWGGRYWPPCWVTSASDGRGVCRRE